MGCFSVFPCYPSSKHPKPTEESTNIGSLQAPISKSRVDSEDNGINEDVETNTEIVYVKSEDDEDKNVGKLGVLVQLESAKEKDDERKNRNRKLGVLVQIETENERKEAKENSLDVHVEIENEKIQTGTVSDSSVSSYVSFPPMHRYHNCVTDEDEEHLLIQDDSPESFFSLPIDPTRQSTSSSVQVHDKEVNSPLKTSSLPESIENNHNESIDSLLSPIENLAQRKPTKERPMPGLDSLQDKENLYLEHEAISKVSDRKGKLKTDTVVTTSLSSWLVDPEKSTARNEESQTSWKSFEDRPILAAWSVDDVKKISARSSPRKSPCHNPDDKPIIGTVGSYWSHTGQTTDSSNSCISP